MDRLSALPSELLHMICQFVQLCGVQHIALLRSCNHCLTNAASQYLFPVLVVGTRKRLLRRVRWVAARPQFAQGVREIEYDTTKYTGGSERRAWRRYFENDDPWIPRLHYWLNMHKDQVRILRTGEVLDTLVSTLPYFPHVRTATISNRDVGRKSQMPFPSYGAVGFTTSPEHQTHGYLCLVQAFAESSHSLREFSVFAQNLKDGEMLSGMLRLQLPEVVSATQATFEHLTDVCLKSTTHCNFGVQEFELHEILEIGLIAQVLGYATQLRRLSLTFYAETSHRREVPFVSVIGKHTWSSLQQIELDGMDIPHATELCEFLTRHRHTMTTITLRNINLMDGQWMTVADCLQGLPELHGLLLEGLEVESCEYLYCVTIMEITDHAMGGRRNNLIPDMDTLLGALNSY